MATRAFDNHPITLYSNLMEWLQALNMRSAPAAQWVVTIISAKGMREDEIEHSVLLSFLGELDKTDKVTKEQRNSCSMLLKVVCLIVSLP